VVLGKKSKQLVPHTVDFRVYREERMSVHDHREGREKLAIQRLCLVSGHFPSEMCGIEGEKGQGHTIASSFTSRVSSRGWRHL
jgi:hypothetical protein